MFHVNGSKRTPNSLVSHVPDLMALAKAGGSWAWKSHGQSVPDEMAQVGQHLCCKKQHSHEEIEQWALKIFMASDP